ncbi:hypothetical protein [Nocardia sp. NPDC050717]|uniref:hypothetical protein n=1 Tax=Nocardia sp. NPDC050717 TaxID=3157221 RepID=UPI0034053294
MIGRVKVSAHSMRLLGLFGGVAVLLLMTNWSPMRAVAFAIIWAVAAAVLLVRDRRRPVEASPPE